MDQLPRQRTQSSRSQSQPQPQPQTQDQEQLQDQEHDQRLVEQFLQFADSPEPSNLSLSSAASALGISISGGAMDQSSRHGGSHDQPFSSAVDYQHQHHQHQQQQQQQHQHQHQQHSLTPAQMMWGNVAATSTNTNEQQQQQQPSTHHQHQYIHVNGQHDDLSAILLSPTPTESTYTHHHNQQYPPATMPPTNPSVNGMSPSPIPSHSRQNSRQDSAPAPPSGNDMLAILAQSFSNTQATQELLLRKLEEQTQQNALLQTKLAEVERQQREMTAAATAFAHGGGGSQQQQQHAQSVAHSALNSAIHSAVASPMSMGTNPPLPSGFGSHRSQHLVASRNVSLDVNTPFVAPINAPPNAFTPSEAFSRLSMQAHEPFSPLTSPVFQTYLVPSPTVAQAANGNALPPLPPAAQLDHGSASSHHGHHSQDVDMDWLNPHDTASMHPSTHQQHQQQQSFPAPTEQPFHYYSHDAQHQQQQQSYLPATPAALMSSGGGGSTDASNALNPAMPSTLMHQWNTNGSSSFANHHQPNNDSPSPRMPPAALPPPSSSLAKESSSSARSSSSPGPLIGNKPVPPEHANPSSSSSRRAVTKHASKLAAAPYVRQSPRMTPMSPAMVATLGSPALGPRRNSPPNMVATAAAAAAAAAASPAMVPVGAVPLTPANALGPNSSTATYQYPPTPAMPPTPTSQTLHPISSGQMHPSQSAAYRQMPPNLSLVSPAIHPTAASGATTSSADAGSAPPAFPTPLPPPAIDIPHTYHPYHQQHPPHLINLSGLGGYSTLGLGGGMLLHDYLGFPGPGGSANGPGTHAAGGLGSGGAASASAAARGGASAQQQDDDDMDDDDDPEARKHSHRSAEQKRRNAMKDGFDELRRLVPGLQNSVTTRRSKYNPIEPQAPVSRKKRRDAKNEGKGISKIMVLKSAYDYCAFLAGRERRLREAVVQLAQRQQMDQGMAHLPQVPVPADLLESADDIFFTYVKETLWKSAAAQQQAADEILMAAGDEPAAAAVAGVATAAGSFMGDGSATAANLSPASAMGQEANGTVAKAVAAVAKATGSTPAVAKAVVQKVSKSNAAGSSSTDVVMAER